MMNLFLLLETHINENSEIIANNFEYDLKKNIINADQNVKIENKEDSYTIFSDNITYFRNEELYKTRGNSKAINENSEIIANNFEYDLKKIL